MTEPEFMPVYLMLVTFRGEPERRTYIRCSSWHTLIGKKWHGWFDLEEYTPQPQPRRR